jgi:hypothetical protein
MRRFFFSCPPSPSPRSLSLASRFAPAVGGGGGGTDETAADATLRGVSGGVDTTTGGDGATPTIFDGEAAVMLGMLPPISVGVVMAPVCGDGMEHVEFERAGDAGRPMGPPPTAVAGGDGAANDAMGPRGGGLANAAVGAGVGGTEMPLGPASSPVYAAPSSPGENERVEQKPSDDVMRRVRPSVDLEGGE